MARVEKMFEIVRDKLPGPPEFLLCVLAEKKNSEIYGMSVYCFLDLPCLQSSDKFYIVKGPWKRKSLSEFGIVTQCISPTKINDQYLTNVLLKINTKVYVGIKSHQHFVCLLFC